MNTKGQLSPNLSAALETFINRGKVLIALDFDGTLAPLVDDPSTSRPLPGSVQAIDQLLAVPTVSIAYVSGREIAVLRQLASPAPEILLAGSHGAELWFGGDHLPLSLNTTEEETLAALDTALQNLAAQHSEVWIEAKPAGRVVHTRAAAPSIAQKATQKAVALSADFSEVRVTTGKDVVEFAVRHANKGDAIAAFREHTTASSVLYAGDDTTDEDAFAALGATDLSIKVGAGETLATHRVADPQAVTSVLRTLTELTA